MSCLAQVAWLLWCAQLLVDLIKTDIGAEPSLWLPRRCAVKQCQLCTYMSRLTRRAELDEAARNAVVVKGVGRAEPPVETADRVRCRAHERRLTIRIRISFLENRRANSFVNVSPMAAQRSVMDYSWLLPVTQCDGHRNAQPPAMLPLYHAS